GRLIRLGVGVLFSVAVRIENEWYPALCLRFVFRLEINFCVEPTLDLAAAREPQHIIIIEIQMMRAEASIHGCDLFRFRIVDFNLASALVNGKYLRGWVIRALLAKWLRLILSNPCSNPNAAFLIHREAVGIGLACPDGFFIPVWRWLRRLGVAF